MSTPAWKAALMVQIQTIYRSLSYGDRLALSRFLLETAAKVAASADLNNSKTDEKPQSN